MHLFESLDAILLAALALLVLARKLAIPYPTLLAAAGLAFAALPFAPHIQLDPELALALFIAPALLHAAYHTSPRALRRFWFALVALAVFAVLITTAAVTLLGWWWVGLPLAAAFALGAIVAPPDAAAAEAVTSEVELPRRGQLLLQGESLLNDATALLLYGVAVSLAMGRDVEGSPWQLALAAPGGATWTWGPDDAPERVEGSAQGFALLVTQRVHRDDTDLVATGAGATRWLEVAQAFAGPPGAGRQAVGARA